MLHLRISLATFLTERITVYLHCDNNVETLSNNFRGSIIPKTFLTFLSFLKSALHSITKKWFTLYNIFLLLYIKQNNLADS